MGLTVHRPHQPPVAVPLEVEAAGAEAIAAFLAAPSPSAPARAPSPSSAPAAPDPASASDASVGGT